MSEPELPTHVPEGPSDNTTLVAVIDHYAEAGFAGSFDSGEGPTVTCHACGVTSPASSVAMASMRRLEGASDPDDMIAVVAVRCPRCRTGGILVLGYGPAGSDLDNDVLAAMRDRRHDTPMPADAAPGESTSG